MAEIFEMPFVSGRTFQIHALREPVTLFGRGLRTPVCPKTELGIAEPFGYFVGAKRLARSHERPFFDFKGRCVCWQFSGKKKSRGCARRHFERVASSHQHRFESLNERFLSHRR